ncbi:MAG: exonuclease SbcCD subunit D [Clostridia bacterium]|nr:exonuclease SbcCD subunit D [Clostridia bacterium]
MIKLVHISDLHLDTPFAGCDLAERSARRSELRDGLSAVCRYCKENSVQLLLIAGDLFESDYTSRETARFVAECLGTIPETRVFISPGNHDPYNGASPYRYCQFPDNVHIFSGESLESVEIPELHTAVYGYAFTGESMTENPVHGIHPFDTDRINILVAHGDYDVPRSPYYSISHSDICESGLDYVALGHIHKPSGIMNAGGTVWAYSGCLIGRDFGECGERGMIAGTISKESGANLSYIPVTKASFEELRIDTNDKSIDEAIEEARRLRSELASECRVRITLCGTDRARLDIIRQNLLSDATMGFCEVLEEISESAVFEEIADEFSMRGEFARRLRPYIESEDESVRETAEMALRLGLEALKK